MRRILLAIVLFSIPAIMASAQDAKPLPKYGPKATRLYDAREHIQKCRAPDFWALLPYYRAQTTDAGCSVPVVSMLLNALKVHDDLSSEEMLVTPENLLEKLNLPQWSKAVAEGGEGVSLDELREIVEKCFTAYGLQNFRVDVIHIDKASDAELEKLRKRLIQNGESDRNFLIANFLQSTFTGDPEGNVGHFAPIAAYDARLKRVLILDPDRDWYEPYWVSDETLLEGMATTDPVAKKSRGFLWVHATP